MAMILKIYWHKKLGVVVIPSRRTPASFCRRLFKTPGQRLFFFPKPFQTQKPYDGAMALSDYLIVNR